MTTPYLASPPTPYSNLDRQVIGGIWREGRSDHRNVDCDPYTGAAQVEIRSASHDDVDAAYGAAAEAQRRWAGLLPNQRTQVLHCAAAFSHVAKEHVDEYRANRSFGPCRLPDSDGID